MTLNTQWSWRPNDEVKSLKQCIDVLVTCAGRNGNLALNTGPMPNGQIEPRQAAVPGDRGVAQTVRREHLRDPRRALLGAPLRDDP